MRYKIFKISKPSIEFTYPSDWVRGMEENNTYLFFNENLGSLRVTPVQVQQTGFDINAFLESEFEENVDNNSEWTTIGELPAIYYKCNSAKSDDIITHYWVTGKNIFLLILSFAYARTMDNSIEILEELKKVQATITSLVIN